jgi:uncharacterized membrane protein
MHMNNGTLATPIPILVTKLLSFGKLIEHVQRVIAPLFALFFLLFALFFALSAAVEFMRPILNSGDLVEGLIKGLHMGVVALALYELTQIVYQEYDTVEAPESMVRRIRRGIIRFVSVVCTALVLESLILVIKYSQKDLAGFLYYPVALIVGAALLLVALGVFTRLTRDVEQADRVEIARTR